MTYVLGTSNVPVAEARDTLLGSAASLIEIGAPTLSPLSGAAPASERTRHWVSVYGDIILGADLQLSGQGFLVAEERSSTGTRRMHVLLDGDSGEKWTSWKDGIIVDSDEVARDWLATIVSESVRQELQEIRDSGVLRASALAHQPDGTRVTIIAISEGMQFGMAGMNRMVFPAGPSPSALGFEFLTQAYSHGLVGQGLFELTLHHALPLVLPEAVDEALYAVAHVDDLSFRAVFREVLSTER